MAINHCIVNQITCLLPFSSIVTGSSCLRYERPKEQDLIWTWFKGFSLPIHYLYVLVLDTFSVKMSPPVIRICVVLVRQSVMLFFSGSTHKQACLCSTVCWWRDGWGEGGEGGRRGSWIPQHHSHRLPPPLRPVSWGHAVKGHAPRRQVEKTHQNHETFG